MTNIAPGIVLSERYKLTEKIGRGGMAEVWLGQDMTLGRQVAVKVMLPQFAMEPEFVTRFRHEAAAAANLSNPYIVNIYDWGQDGQIQYIVMEYVNGQNLKTMIQTKGALPTMSAARIGAQVCQALASAHHMDIIHRDIKPQNIMIQRNGNVKVMDFGIARAKNSTMQKTQVVLGTAQYVSPEQAQGLELSAQSDIYSLGIVLYEAVTGELPFNGEDAVSVALKQVEELPVPPSKINPDVDPAFEAIILKALAKDPDDRFVSVQEMSKALEDYANGIRDFSAATTTLINQQAPRDINDVVAGETKVMPPSDAQTQAQQADSSLEDKAQADKKKKRNIIIAAVIAAVAAIAVAALAVTFIFPNSVSVPNVVGASVEQATRTIEGVGLEVGAIEEVPSKDVPIGYVADTDPEAGVDVSKGTKVTLLVSTGPSEVKVPDLLGLGEDEAKRALESVGLKGQRGPDEPSATVPEGKVASQTPESGELVEAGTIIIYAISSGADTVTVPDLSGLTESAAMKLLEELGLTGLVGSKQASDTVEEGLVISQNPAKDVKVDLGSQVTFTISTGIASVTVPALEGLTQTAARSTLINAGLVLGNVTEEFSNEPRGTVISQSEIDGSSIAKGSKVDIVISRGSRPQNTNSNNQNTNSNVERGE